MQSFTALILSIWSVSAASPWEPEVSEAETDNLADLSIAFGWMEYSNLPRYGPSLMCLGFTVPELVSFSRRIDRQIHAYDAAVNDMKDNPCFDGLYLREIREHLWTKFLQALIQKSDSSDLPGPFFPPARAKYCLVTA